MYVPCQGLEADTWRWKYKRVTVSRRISMVWSSEIALHRVIRGWGQFWRFASIECTLYNVRTGGTHTVLFRTWRGWLAQFDWNGSLAIGLETETYAKNIYFVLCFFFFIDIWILSVMFVNIFSELADNIEVYTRDMSWLFCLKCDIRLFEIKSGSKIRLKSLVSSICTFYTFGRVQILMDESVTRKRIPHSSISSTA